MSREAEILETLRARCAAEGVVPAHADIDPNADLVESGQIDSMGLVHLQALIEDAFGVRIPAEVFVAELHTFSKIASYVESELRARRDHSVV